MTYTEQLVNRDSVVDIVTSYEQDGQGMESRRRGGGRARFSALIQNGPGAHPGFFREVKRSGRGVDHTPPIFHPLLGLRGLFCGGLYILPVPYTVQIIDVHLAYSA